MRAMPLRDLASLLPQFAERESRDAESYPTENVAALHKAGALLAPFGPRFGGEGASLSDGVRAIEALAGVSPSTALIAAMPLGLAGVFAIGADVAPAEFRESWARQIEEAAAAYREGKLYAACNSEKGAGGSLAATKTTAELRDGRFHLSGEKILATSGKHADRFFSTAKVLPQDLPGCGVVEFFLVDTRADGVAILDDWDGFGMRSSESQTVRYASAPVESLLGFPNFIQVVQPLQYWFCLFAAIPLGCAGAILKQLSEPMPQSPALRLRLADATMRYESLRAYLLETAAGWRAGAGPEYGARVLRTKTFVTQESTKLAAELFALSGGRHYRRDGAMARLLADSFAGTALRPPLALGLETLIGD
jgi:alkylation response protein AidB-like acyl-CoA dehydrogenase